MEFKRVIGSRRDTRMFLPWKPVEREKIQKMLETARLSSRAVNTPWGKAVVTYRDWLTDEQRDSLKTPIGAVEYDLAPVYIFWYFDMAASRTAIEERRWPTVASGALVDVGALNPTHGWSQRYVQNVVLPEVLTPGISRGLQRGGNADAALAMEAALLTAVDEGLGACLVPFDEDAAKEILGVPDTWEPVLAILVGYAAESLEGMGQNPSPITEDTSFEGSLETPFWRDESVLDRLRQSGMLQREAPMPWREEEVQRLGRMLGITEE